jgi:hypothetical protein
MVVSLLQRQRVRGVLRGILFNGQNTVFDVGCSMFGVHSFFYRSNWPPFKARKLRRPAAALNPACGVDLSRHSSKSEVGNAQHEAPNL